MNKNHIISEIKRIAKENNGNAPGFKVFERETGIRESDWYPYIWLRWGDALLDAGYAPNKFKTAIDSDLIIQSYIGLVRELGKLPVAGEIRHKSKNDKSFPSHNVFNRFGGKENLIEAVVLYCQTHPGNEDIIILCSKYTPIATHEQQENSKKTSNVNSGFVYLMKSGKHYKIGRTNSVGRREREFAIQIPVPPKTIHRIETDDPVGLKHTGIIDLKINEVRENGLICHQMILGDSSVGNESSKKCSINESIRRLVAAGIRSVGRKMKYTNFMRYLSVLV